jgi:MFS superfamily sulfate permease-like transporter
MTELFVTLCLAGSIVLISTIFLVDIFVYVPSAALAGLIMVSTVTLFNWGDIKAIWKKQKTDIIPFCVTFFACLHSTSLGIILGIIVHIGMLLLEFVRPIKIEKDGVILLNGPLLYPTADVS